MKSCILAFFALFSLQALASEHEYGLGFILGEPTAISFKYNRATTESYDAQLSFAFHDYLILYGDRLWNFPGLFRKNNEFTQHLVPYVGVGPVLAFAGATDHSQGDYFHRRSDSFAMGVRVPFGAEWMWEKVPLGIGLELAPAIVILPGTEGFLMGGLTIRYYF